jgi:hypothetical protein
MLSDLFRINLPYGMLRNEAGEWMAFNREYKPVGFHTRERIEYGDYPVFSPYLRLTDSLIMELTEHDEHAVTRDDKGNIRQFWLYNDSTNPMNQPSKENKFWDRYWHKLEKLAKLSVRKDRYS